MVKLKKKKPPLNNPLGLPSSLFNSNPVPNGLTPIGDSGFYMTPDEPADPLDCERYPGSIFCDNPFGNFVFLEPSIILDECNTGVQLNGSLGFIKVPPVVIVYRNRNCRIPPPIQKQKTIEIKEDFNQPVDFIIPNCPQGVYGGFTHFFEHYEEAIIKDNDGSLIRKEITYYKLSIEILEFDFPYKVPYGYDQVGIAYLHIKYKVSILTKLNKAISGYTSGVNVPISGTERENYQERIERAWIRDFNSDSSYQGISYIGKGIYDFVGVISSPNVDNLSSEGIALAGILAISFVKNDKTFSRPIHSYKISTYTEYTDRQSNKYVSWTSLNTPFCVCERPVFPPPPPIIKLPKEDMVCCPEHTKLLKQLIAKVNKLSTIVGVDEYPASLPASLISKDEGFLGNLIPNANKEILNLTQFMLWYVERFDEIMGQWEIPIEIKDSDPSKPGDQPLGVKLPNMAEAIAEMFSLAFQTNLNSEVLLNFAVRNAAESMADKQQNFMTYKLLQSLTEWAGYKQKDIKLKMPMLYTLNKTRYDEILKESEVEVLCVDFDEKFGLAAQLMRYNEAAGILQALYKKKIDPNGDIKGQILKYLLDTFAATKKINTDDADDDLDKFIQQVEEGFGSVPGITDPAKPYGRDYTQRPRIRDLGKYQAPEQQ